MTRNDHAHYFARRERQCRALADTHTDPILRRVYEKFANNYAQALNGKDGNRASSSVRIKENH